MWIRANSVFANSHAPKRRLALTAGLAAAIVLATASLAAASSVARDPRGVLARILDATDTAQLQYNERDSEGSTLIEEGSASGSLPGRMRARLSLGSTFSGSFTFYTRNGALKGRGTATPSHSAGRYESFRGSLTIVGGTGRYTHAHGRAGLYGTLDLKTFAVVVQTTGKLFY